MIWQQIIYIILALIAGGFFSYLGIPAGWLLGSLLFGIIIGLIFKKLPFEGLPFQMALAMVGTSIGFMMERELFFTLHIYLFPLLVTLSLTLAAGLLFGWLMYKWTDLDILTAFFCCVPGGASEVISVSREYGADDRIVAAFHTARITFFVLVIPFAAGIFYPVIETEAQVNGSYTNLTLLLPILFVVISLSIILNRKVKIPAGALLYSIFIGFLVSEFLIPLESPSYIAGIGQGLIGAMIGIRFDKVTLHRLKLIGLPSVGVIQLFFLFSLCLALIFFLLTPLPYMTSLLSTVPAGAAEMASTAFALQLEPTLVSSLHVIRVMVLFLVLPFLLKIILKIAK
ncbi:AbrB family transcriptional regulator [Thalassobacillus sp. C254]|uniref:AbrB family transcriptional regulator n=1 Tax=Thalassobacillus sp. C254 TaxID=1225341 RepID=UPI0006CF3955|nr:AbrB family transcriptional regulator [Thalassobacillus sp. C254]